MNIVHLTLPHGLLLHKHKTTINKELSACCILAVAWKRIMKGVWQLARYNICLEN